MKNHDIESYLLSITHDFLLELEAERALRAITLDASLERDLGIDSLGKVELMHRIENKFSIRLPEKAMIEAESLRDLAVIIEEAITTRPTTIKPQSFTASLEKISIDLSTVKTFTEALVTYAHKQAQRPHIILQNEQGIEQTISYGKLFTEASYVAKGLVKQGIQAGETIAIMLPSSEDFFYAFCGVLLAGAIPVPIYPPFRSDRIEEYTKRETKILQNAQARILITFADAEILSNILQTFIPSLKEVITVKKLQVSSGTLPILSTETNETAIIQYTSGSTGDPKGVLITHENLLANIRAIREAIPIQPTDVVVSWLPLYHDMGLMCWLGSLYYGIPIIILSPITFLTRPERWLWAIHYHRATLSGGPNFAYELCAKKINSNDIEGLDLSSWRFAFNGAEAINPKTLERFIKKFSVYGFKAENFAPVYGLAEATVALTFPPEKRIPLIDKIQRHLFETENKAIPIKTTQEKDTLEFVACGIPLPKHKIRIVDDKGHEVAERIVGNVQFSGPSAMSGYFNNPSATQKAYHNGWWHTGDLGYIANQELFISGRKKDLIIKAGRNLYPEEVEEVINQIANIRKGCVIAFGANDPNTGTEKLIVVAETYQIEEKQKQQTRMEIIEKMAISLGIPPDIVILLPPRSIPKTSSGKLQRSACKQAYLEGKLTRQPLPAKLQLAKLAFISINKKIYQWLGFASQLLYGIYVSLILLITIPIVWLCIYLLPREKAAKFGKIYARNFFRLAFCPITVIGEKNLQHNDNATIFVANHASYIDSLVLIAVLPINVAFTAKKELLKISPLKTFIEKLNYLVIDRLDFLKSLENKKNIEIAVKQGRSMVIFPEATFTYATGLRPFKLGAFTIAVETETPICPIALQGTRSILRGNNWLPKPGKIKVTIGKPITPKINDWNEIIRLHALVRNEIAKYCGEPVIDVIVAGPMTD